MLWQDVVYAFKPASNCAVSVSLCGSAFDTRLALYSRSDDWSDLTEVACNDDYCQDRSYLQVSWSGSGTAPVLASTDLSLTCHKDNSSRDCMIVLIDVNEANKIRKKVFVSYGGMMQAVMSAGSIYYLVISGFQAAAGQYQLDVRALDSSSVAGLQLRGSYAEAPAAAAAAANANASLTGSQPTCRYWRVAEDRNPLLSGDTIISIRVQSKWRRHCHNSHVGASHDP